MKHQATVRLAIIARIYRDAKEVGNRGFMRAWFLAAMTSAVCWLGGSTLQAEDQGSKAFVGEQQISGNYFLEILQAPSLFFRNAPETDGFQFRELFSLLDARQPELLFGKETKSATPDGDRSVTLFRKRRSSRYAYQAWADLGTGYGQIFTAESFGRSRTNGVGVQDPDCFYFMMSFKF